MTCEGEPANINLNEKYSSFNRPKSMGISIGKDKRYCSTNLKPQNLGPTNYNNTINEKYKFGAFGKASRNFDIKKMGKFNEYCLRNK